MKTITLIIDATGTAQDMASPGHVLIIDTVTNSDPVSIDFLDAGGQEIGKIRNALAGHKYVLASGFGGVRFTGTVGDTVQAIVCESGDDATTLNKMYIQTPITLTASSVKINANAADVDDAHPFPIKAPGTLAVQAVLSAAPADLAPVVSVNAEADLVAADATRRAFIARNVGGTEVALYSTSGTAFASCAIRLLPGEAHLEIRSPGARWYQRRDPAGADSSIAIHVDK